MGFREDPPKSGKRFFEEAQVVLVASDKDFSRIGDAIRELRLGTTSVLQIGFVNDSKIGDRPFEEAVADFFEAIQLAENGDAEKFTVETVRPPNGRLTIFSVRREITKKPS